MFVEVEGLVTSLRTFAWFPISFRAASSLESWACAAAAPSASLILSSLISPQRAALLVAYL